MDEFTLLNPDGSMIAKLQRDAQRVASTIDKVMQTRKAAVG